MGDTEGVVQFWGVLKWVPWPPPTVGSYETFTSVDSFWFGDSCYFPEAPEKGIWQCTKTQKAGSLALSGEGALVGWKSGWGRDENRSPCELITKL